MATPIYNNIILDIDAFKNYEKIKDIADTFYTTEFYKKDALNLCTDPQQKEFISKVQTLTPTAESQLFIRTFARETGEMEKLSELDILFMSLAYDIEKEKIGLEHINKIPILDRSRYFQHTNKLREVGVNVCAEPCLYFSMPGGCSRGDVDNRPIPRLASTHLDSATENRILNDKEKESINFFPLTTYSENGTHVHGGSGSLVLTSSDDESDDANIAWIDDKELSSFDINVPDMTIKPIKNHVVCCTGNSVIQNLLLQMRFQLLSLDLKPITKLKIWTRKCSLCFRVCKDESRTVCPFCGNRSLKRVQAFFNSNGLVSVGDFPFPLDKPKNKKNKRKKQQKQ